MKRSLKFLTAITLSLLLVFGSSLGAFADQNTSIHLKTGFFKTELAGLSFYVYLEGHVGTDNKYHNSVDGVLVTILPMTTSGGSGQYNTPDLMLTVDPKILYFEIGGLKYYIGTHISYVGKEGGGTINYKIDSMPKPPNGSIKITKIITGDIPLNPGIFEFKIYAVGETDIHYHTVTITGANTKVIEGVPQGYYYVTESDMPANYNLVTMNNKQNANVTPQELNPSVTFENNYSEPKKGSITIVKDIVGDTPYPAETFHFQLVGPLEDEDNMTRDFTLDGKDSKTFNNLKQGDYRITELPTSQNYTIESGNNTLVSIGEVLTSTVTITNRYTAPDPDLGSITIVKDIVGDTPYPDETFHFQLVGPLEDEDNMTRDFTLDGKDSKTFNNLKQGDYRITELPTSQNYTIESGNNTLVTIGEVLTSTVTITNRYTAPSQDFGSITVNKTITGDTPPPNSTFTFRLVGPSGEGSTTSELSRTGAGPVTFSGLSYGTYTLTEVGLPSNFSIVSGNNVQLSIHDETPSVTATITNSYTTPPTPPPPPPTPPTPDLGTVRVHHVDTEENLLDPIFEFSGTVGTNYATAAREYEDLELVAIPDNATGTFIDGIIDVFYVYSPGVEPLVILEVEEETPLGPPTVPEEEVILTQPIPLAPLPQTGQLPAELFYGFGSIISMIGVAFRKGKKNR